MIRYLLIEVFGDEGVQNGAENAAAALIRHLSQGQQVEVAQQTVSDGVTATPWGSHGCHKLSVNDLLEGTGRPPLIPALQPKHTSSGFAKFVVSSTLWFNPALPKRTHRLLLRLGLLVYMQVW